MKVIRGLGGAQRRSKVLQTQTHKQVDATKHIFSPALQSIINIHESLPLQHGHCCKYSFFSGNLLVPSGLSSSPSIMPLTFSPQPFPTLLPTPWLFCPLFSLLPKIPYRGS